MKSIRTLFQVAYNYANKFLYTVLYYVIGAKGVFEDILNRRHNRVDIVDKTGYVAVVTGGARGIGSHVVKLLMQCNMHVVIGCRNVEAGRKLIDDLRKQGVTKGEASVLQLDMKSLRSVKNFAEEILKRFQSVDILVNNAGIMFAPYEETEDGFESHTQVNYLGHFLLTQLLMPALKNAFETSSHTKARIVNVSSCAHEVSPQIDFNDFNMKGNYVENAAYSRSKLCQIMFTKTLQRKLTESGSPVQVFAVHPGIVDTDIFNNTVMKLLTPWLINLFCKRPVKGAVSVVYACISEKLENKGGVYLSNCRPAKNLKYADHKPTQEKLYQLSLDSVRPFLVAQ